MIANRTADTKNAPRSVGRRPVQGAVFAELAGEVDHALGIDGGFTGNGGDVGEKRGCVRRGPTECALKRFLGEETDGLGVGRRRIGKNEEVAIVRVGVFGLGKLDGTTPTLPSPKGEEPGFPMERRFAAPSGWFC